MWLEQVDVQQQQQQQPLYMYTHTPNCQSPYISLIQLTYALLVRWELKEPYQDPTKPPQIQLLVVKHSQKSPGGNGIEREGYEMHSQKLTIETEFLINIYM